MLGAAARDTRETRAWNMLNNIVPHGGTVRSFVVREAGEYMYGSGELRLVDSVCFRPTTFVEDLRFSTTLSVRNKAENVKTYLLQAKQNDDLMQRRPPVPPLVPGLRRVVSREYERLLNRHFIHIKSQFYGVCGHGRDIHRVSLNERAGNEGARAIECTCKDYETHLSMRPCKHMLFFNLWRARSRRTLRW